MRLARLAIAIGLLAACAGQGGAASRPVSDGEAGRPILESPAPAADLETCVRDDACVLTTWACSPCGTCPGFPPRAVTRAALASERAACRWERLDAPRADVACSPCRPPPAALPSYEARCRDRKCVRVP